MASITVPRRVAALIRRVWSRVQRHQSNTRDQLLSALYDAELLVAFAAQSTRGIKAEKVKALFNAVSAIRVKLASKQVSTADELASFWISYDDLALGLAPLSAQSIRASAKINSSKFPASLLTPTAYNAALAVLVFFLCLGMQGFWVAGKELVERADLLEQQKSEIEKKLATNTGLLRRLENKQLRAKEKLCVIVQCDAKSPAKQIQLKSEIESVAAAKAELDLLLADLTEKKQIEIEFNRDLLSLNEKSRPLEELLRKWHDRARLVCDAAYLKFLCPVDNPKVGSDEQPELRQQLKAARQALEHASEEALKPTTEPGAQTSALERLFRGFGVPSAVKRKQSEVERLEQEIAAKEADRFRSIVVEVRIIVANIGAYLIAMVMGLLGALTFILRSLSQQLRDHTYVPTSASVSIVRICLGAIAGVFGTLLIPNSDTTIRTLPPLFIPFVFGYGIEILFSLLDKLVRSFTQAPSDAKPLSS